MLKHLAPALILAFAASACGVGIDGDACNYVGTSANMPRCTERETKQGDPTADFKAACEAAGGSYGGGCPSGKVGGCELENDDTERLVDWYYPPLTREDAMTKCMGTFIED